MLCKVNSAVVIGIQSFEIAVEVDCSKGLPAFNIVGLGDNAVKESRDRVFSALKNSGYSIPNKRMVINLAPAYMKKMGSSLDVPIALGLLLASNQIEVSYEKLKSCLVLGELSLGGEIRPVQGCLSVCLYAYQNQIKKVYIPFENYSEVEIVKGVKIIPVKSMLQMIDYFLKDKKIDYPKSKKSSKKNQSSFDFSEVKGQKLARRACEISIAGNHNFLLIGSPGCGKSMLSKRLPTIFPDMDLNESLESTMIHSSAGTLPVGEGILSKRPFRNPHHNISQSALVGGGSYPKPGEVSLAHHGILFLDELGEFQQYCLNVLRQPLEDGEVLITRAKMSLRYPSRFIFGAAMNPCPCGFLIDVDKKCICQHKKIKNYLAKISGPLLDRIDLQVEMTSLTKDEIMDNTPSEGSLEIKKRVEKVWKIQKKRYCNCNYRFNAHLTSRDLKHFCLLSLDAQNFLREYVEKNFISSRAYDRSLKVSRTIADLENEEIIQKKHIAEAFQYRGLEQIKNYLENSLI